MRKVTVAAAENVILGLHDEIFKHAFGISWRTDAQMEI